MNEIFTGMRSQEMIQNAHGGENALDSFSNLSAEAEQREVDQWTCSEDEVQPRREDRTIS
jgi:hypothetical protein